MENPANFKKTLMDLLQLELSNELKNILIISEIDKGIVFINKTKTKRDFFKLIFVVFCSLWDESKENKAEITNFMVRFFNFIQKDIDKETRKQFQNPLEEFIKNNKN